MKIAHIPSGWEKVSLGTVCGKCEQRQPLAGEKFTYIDIASVDRKKKTITEPQHLPGEKAPSRARKIIKFGDVIVSMTRPNLNAVALIPPYLNNEISSTGFEILRPIAIDSSLVFYLVRSQKFVNSMTRKVQGALYPAVKSTDIREFEFALPPLTEQIQIATKLDELLAQVDTLKTRLDAIPAILKRFRQSVLAAAVNGRLTEKWRHKHNAENWPTVSLKDIAQGFSYGTSSKSSKEGEVPVLRMGNIQGGKLDWKNLVFSSVPTEIEKFRLSPGDVLFNRTNSPELVGKTAIFRGEREAIYAGYLIRIKTDNKTTAEFINIALNSPQGRSYCWRVKSDGVSQSNINAKKLAAYPLNLPSMPEQTEIVRQVEQLFAHADRIEQGLKAAQARVDQLTQSILARAFSGELTADWRAQNPDLISGDNSAAALLQRIQAERAAAKPAKTRKRRRKPRQPA
jgi:type I restriction enzyme S subunit